MCLKVEEGQQILAADDLKDKYRLLIAPDAREGGVALEQKIQSEAHEEMEKAQRSTSCASSSSDPKGAGRGGGGQAANEEYQQKIEQAMLPEEAKKRCCAR
jgi:ATP-dependent Lon protease